MFAKRKKEKQDKNRKEERRDQSVIRPKKYCHFCKAGREPVYTEWEDLFRFITDRGKIVARERSGVCAKHQRRLAKAIKYARHLALLPFMVRPE